MEENEQGFSFTSPITLTKMGISEIPKRYLLPPSHRPIVNATATGGTMATLPVIDLAPLHQQSSRAQVIEDIRDACEEFGFFQVINHGVCPTLMNEVVQAADDFFNLPMEDKMHLISSDVNKPVRYGTSLNHVKDKVHFWRDFLKHYSNPLSKWIDSWPSNPPSYKEKMGNYARATHSLQMELLEAIFESLGLDPKYLNKEIKEGSQVMAVNCYPACPEPQMVLGMPPHSDYGSITILLQTYQGLEVKDKEGEWIQVPVIENALLVHLGDHMEILSNGAYKSVVHRVVVNAEKRRFSIASLHSLALETSIGPAPELVDELKNPKGYKESSFKDFLDFISENDIMQERFLETLKIK